jgi:hypothetical protein
MRGGKFRAFRDRRQRKRNAQPFASVFLLRRERSPVLWEREIPCIHTSCREANCAGSFFYEGIGALGHLPGSKAQSEDRTASRSQAGSFSLISPFQKNKKMRIRFFLADAHFYQNNPFLQTIICIY